MNIGYIKYKAPFYFFWRRDKPKSIEQEILLLKEQKVDLIYLPFSFRAYKQAPLETIEKLEKTLKLISKHKMMVMLSLFSNENNPVGAQMLELPLDKMLVDYTWGYERGFYQRYFMDVLTIIRRNNNVTVLEIARREIPKLKPIEMNMFYSVYSQMYCLLNTAHLGIPICFGVDSDLPLPNMLTDITHLVARHCDGNIEGVEVT